MYPERRYEADDESFEYDREADDEMEAPQPRLARRVRRIRGAAPTRPNALHPVPGSAIVTATLPNGRETRMQLSPAPASVQAINRLRSQVAADDRRQSRALNADARAIRQLSAAQAAAVKKLTDQQVALDRARTKRLVDGDAKLDARISKQLRKATKGTAKRGRRAMAMVKQQGRRSVWNSILLATGAPFFAAFGDRANPFSRDNLVLTASLAGWMLGDEIVDKAVRGRDRESRRTRKTVQRGADLWSYVAPVGNAATAWFLLKDRQQTRFLSGVSPVAIGSTATVVPLDDIAKKYEKDFAKRTDVRAVATIAILPTGAFVDGVRAEVVQGKLLITVTGKGGPAVVAWMVDTQESDD
jgi:hypothetical protein